MVRLVFRTSASTFRVDVDTGGAATRGDDETYTVAKKQGRRGGCIGGRWAGVALGADGGGGRVSYRTRALWPSLTKT